jgi:hypothetical protein
VKAFVGLCMLAAAVLAVLLIAHGDRGVEASTGMSAISSDFRLVAATYTPDRIDMTVEDEVEASLRVDYGLAGDEPSLVAVFELTREPLPGKWHWKGPGIGSVRGVRVQPPPRQNVIIKCPPSTIVRKFVDPTSKMNVCIIGGWRITPCALDREIPIRAPYGHPSITSKWDYKPKWSRSEIPDVPVSLVMPSRSELQALLALPPELELLNFQPEEFGVTMAELEEIAAREFELLPLAVELPADLPSVIDLPEVVETTGLVSTETAACGDLIGGIDNNPVNNCAAPATLTLGIEGCNGIDDDGDGLVDEGCAGVGGTSGLLDDSASPADASESSSARDYTVPIAAAVAAAVAALAAGGRYVRRRLS